MYKQVFGTAMGSPVSVTVANLLVNLVMEEIEEKALSTFDIKLPFRKRTTFVQLFQWTGSETCYPTSTRLRTPQLHS